MKLIIQIPCLNEAETLEVALNDLPKHIDGIDTIADIYLNDVLLGHADNMHCTWEYEAARPGNLAGCVGHRLE